MNETQLNMKAEEYGVPGYMIPGVVRWVLHGVIPGDFLTAVIKGDLFAALGRADGTNIGALKAYGMFFYNAAPMGSFGNESNFNKWHEAGGLEGLRKAKEVA